MYRRGHHCYRPKADALCSHWGGFGSPIADTVILMGCPIQLHALSKVLVCSKTVGSWFGRHLFGQSYLVDGCFVGILLIRRFVGELYPELGDCLFKLDETVFSACSLWKPMQFWPLSCGQFSLVTLATRVGAHFPGWFGFRLYAPKNIMNHDMNLFMVGAWKLRYQVHITHILKMVRALVVLSLYIIILWSCLS